MCHLELAGEEGFEPSNLLIQNQMPYRLATRQYIVQSPPLRRLQPPVKPQGRIPLALVQKQYPNRYCAAYAYSETFSVFPFPVMSCVMLDRIRIARYFGLSPTYLQATRSMLIQLSTRFPSVLSYRATLEPGVNAIRIKPHGVQMLSR